MSQSENILNGTIQENIVNKGIDKNSDSVSYLISVEECWYPDYIGDGNCQDVNNHIGCNFDGGDCCGSCVNKEFCIECLCLSEQNSSTGGQVLIGNGFCNDGLNSNIPDSIAETESKSSNKDCINRH